MKKKSKKKVSRSVESNPASFTLTDTHWFYIGLITISVVVLLYRSVFLGMGPVASDTQSWKSAAHVLEQYEEKTGDTALWDSNIFAGMPAYMISMKNKVPGLDTLFFWMNKLLGAHVFHFIFAGLSLYFFLIYLGIRKPASFFGALTFIFTPHFFSLIEAGHNTKLRAILLIPIVVFGFYYLMRERNLLGVAFAAVALSLQLRAKHPQIVYYTMLALGVILIFEVVRSVRAKDNKSAAIMIALFAASTIAALAVVAQPYASIYEYSQYTMRGSTGSGAGLKASYALQWSFAPKEMLSFLVPQAFGLKSPYYWGDMPFTHTSFYMGLIPLLFAVIALAWKRDHLVWSFIAVAIMALLLAFGRHFSSLNELMLQYFPFYNKFRAPSMILVLVELSVAVWAAIGFEYIMNQFSDKEKNKNILPFLKYGMIAGAGFLIVFLLAGKSLGSFAPQSWFVHASDASQYSPEQLVRLRELRADQLGNGLIVFGFLLTFFSALSYFFLQGKIGKSAFSVLLIIAVLADLWYLDVQHFENFKKIKNYDRNYFRATATDKYLQQDKDMFRILPVGQLFRDNRWSYFHQSVGGYSAAKMKLIQDVLEKNLYQGWDKSMPLNPNILKVLNVKYLIFNRQLPAQAASVAGLTPVHSDPRNRHLVYEFKDVLPRAFLAGNFQVLDAAQISSSLNSPEFDPSQIALLEKDPQAEIKQPGRQSVSISHYDIQNIRIDVTTDTQCLLVLSEIFYPAGWHAYVDNKETEIFKTNYLVRSIVVPAGKHQVEFKFEPSTYFASLNISWVASIILYALLAFAFYRAFPQWFSRLRKNG